MGLVGFAMFLIGLYLAVASLHPWWYYGEGWWAAIIPGLLIALMSVVGLVTMALKKRWAWPWWVCAVLGLWLIVSPSVAGYPEPLDLVWTSYAPGVAIALLGVVMGRQAQRAG